MDDYTINSIFTKKEPKNLQSESTRMQDIKHQSEIAIMTIRDMVVKKIQNPDSNFEFDKTIQVQAKRYYKMSVIPFRIKLIGSFLVLSLIFGSYPPMALFLFVLGVVFSAVLNSEKYLYFNTTLKHDKKDIRHRVDLLIFGQNHSSWANSIFIVFFAAWGVMQLMGMSKNIFPISFVLDNLEVLVRLQNLLKINIEHILANSYGVVLLAVPSSAWLVLSMWEKVFGFKSVNLDSVEVAKKQQNQDSSAPDKDYGY